MSRDDRVHAWDEYIVSGWASQEEQQKLEAWAAANGWSYQREDPSLVGVYIPRPQGAAAHCFNVLSGTVNGRRVRAFEDMTFHGLRRGSARGGAVSALVVIGLPGLPPPELAGPHFDRAITSMDASIPRGAELGLRGAELVIWRQGGLRPDLIASDADLMTRQINSMPPAFWRPPAGH